MIWTPRGTGHDIADRQRDLARLVGNEVDDDPRGLLPRFGFGARDPDVEALDRGGDIGGFDIGIDRASARSGGVGVEVDELRRGSRHGMAARGRDGEIRQRRDGQLARRVELRARQRRASHRVVSSGHERRALDGKLGRLGDRPGLAPRRDVALAADVEDRRVRGRRQQRLVGEHGRHAIDHDALLPRRDRDRASPRDRRTILENRHRCDRDVHDSLRFPPTSSSLPAILIS